ncbi:hypothetical protein C7Y47_23905 [Lysinibacillus sphaericus]|uniref:Uncharacterized protein n=1 Tax=Lysinibacillus sphaericus TaxID=1421 RepID=A0A544U7J8_LYSSH|nr:hypothetical protein [Lysinibacillus sp. SDF0037]TQR26967.1 hypothetical protein C7Y47_23905 [Lysinibacillus sp. SDF0037]
MFVVLKEYIEGEYKITEYTVDGETVSHKVSERLLDDLPEQEPVEVQPKPTLEEMQAQTLLNTEVLIAMKNIGV